MVYEYGIRHRTEDTFDPHRKGMTLAEAQEWIQEWIDDGGNPDVFTIIRRSLGEWEEDEAPKTYSFKLLALPPERYGEAIGILAREGINPV